MYSSKSFYFGSLPLELIIVPQLILYNKLLLVIPHRVGSFDFESSEP